ncbi:hypothetical protein LY78DRAFT_187664 [Colletotrichum sublineola]|nr:hypothetical protein LY78DRAFT_187664 [Colletotrichum sublineola]
MDESAHAHIPGFPYHLYSVQYISSYARRLRLPLPSLDADDQKMDHAVAETSDADVPARCSSSFTPTDTRLVHRGRPTDNPGCPVKSVEGDGACKAGVATLSREELGSFGGRWHHWEIDNWRSGVGGSSSSSSDDGRYLRRRHEWRVGREEPDWPGSWVPRFPLFPRPAVVDAMAARCCPDSRSSSVSMSGAALHYY